jgi:hypothetical protein
MSNELNKRLATFHALLELKEAVAQDDLKAEPTISLSSQRAVLKHFQERMPSGSSCREPETRPMCWLGGPVA